MAAQQNKVLQALGSSLRIADDATHDDNLNGGQSQRLYFSTYNWDSFLLEGVECDSDHPNNSMYSQLFSQYGGASIYVVDQEGNPASTVPGTVTPVVYGTPVRIPRTPTATDWEAAMFPSIRWRRETAASWCWVRRSFPAGPHHSFWRSLYEQL